MNWRGCLSVPFAIRGDWRQNWPAVGPRGHTNSLDAQADVPLTLGTQTPTLEIGLGQPASTPNFFNAAANFVATSAVASSPSANSTATLKRRVSVPAAARTSPMPSTSSVNWLLSSTASRNDAFGFGPGA